VIDNPFNVLAPFMPKATVAQFSEAGATRISIGGALNLVAVAPIISAGKEMLEQGTFTWSRTAAARAEVNKLLG
ncbi:MAG: isocitrate lyase/phosphoenolpyruvate mutase family protein, partial [Gammaproteobacteria bacterium]